jgi:diguanylate cyclase (GGDEF)-like protein/PAS domain S-box-containing protein
MGKNTLHLAITTGSGRVRRSKGHAISLVGNSKIKDDLQADQIQLQTRHQRLLILFADLERAHDRYLTFYESSPVSYISLDQDASILGINLTGAELFSVARGEILGGSFTTFVTFWDLPRFRTLLRKAMKTTQQTSLDLTLQRRDGSTFQAQCDCVRAVCEGRDEIHLTLIDITERKRVEAEVKQLTFHDPLTSLPNRRLLLEHLQTALMRCARTEQLGAVFYIDLDDFKTLNHTYGHAVGDVLLQQVAERLTGCFRKEDMLARTGGDEFVVVAQNLGKNSNAARLKALKLGQKLLKSLSTPFMLMGHKHRISASVGVTLIRDTRWPVETLLKNADLALHSAKTAGRSKVHFFHPDMQAEVIARGLLDSDIRMGLHEKQFLLHYQRQVDQYGRTTGVEALIRWQHPERGLLLPAEFIPYAQEKGLIGLLGQQVLEAACTQLKRWNNLPHMATMSIAIKVSSSEFCQPEYVDRLLATVKRIGANASNLVLELTESVMFFSLDETLAKMVALKSHGVRFALDEFGVGYSSMAYLSRLPLDQLKMDRTFIRDLGRHASDVVVTHSIIALGQSLGLKVLAEGVETEEQRAFLLSHGCSAYQGLLFGGPGPAEEFSTSLSAVQFNCAS